ncbi:hypothetical protein D7D52_10410 [Nocardia yunnanensis]|uniref:Uncharacterized protein n=1 Tax=Nocardia yunnanensis TaxID=2382165 RepID=A0A386ZAC8_9NOCA|nr:hypothetical protein [Nocardia yunnanensis]AYF74207.1 hypothetical protein D7D52_10410 [Nocardia yunnanensis]
MGGTLWLFCGIDLEREVHEGETVYLDRELLAAGDRRVSQEHAPAIFSARGRWYLENRYEGKRLVLENVDTHKIYRIPQRVAQELDGEDFHVYVAHQTVAVQVDGYVRPEGRPECNTLTDGLGRDADLQVRQLLDEKPDWRQAVLVRYSEFMDPTISNPRPLTSDEVERFVPRGRELANQAQRSMKQLTGLELLELGHWLTHSGILLASHRVELPFSPV